MEKIRPRGVTVFGILIILSSILGLWGVQKTRELNPDILNYLQFAVYSLSLLTAVYLLKLRNWARISIMIISIIVAVQGLMAIPYAKDSITRYTIKHFETGFREGVKSGLRYKDVDKARISNGALEQLKGDVEKIMMSVIVIMLAVLAFISMGFNGAVIYYFTRPGVKVKFN